MYCGWGNRNNKWSFCLLPTPPSCMGRLTSKFQSPQPPWILFCLLNSTQWKHICVFQIPLPTPLPTELDCPQGRSWGDCRTHIIFPLRNRNPALSALKPVVSFILSSFLSYCGRVSPFSQSPSWQDVATPSFI